MSKPEFMTAHRLAKGSLWRVKAELVGGTRLEGLVESTDALSKVRISAEAFQALKGLRNRGETPQRGGRTADLRSSRQTMSHSG
jgi:hypothetical protein